MCSRIFAPSGPVTYYRITAPLPLIVAFPSVAYQLSLAACPAAGRYEIEAKSGAVVPTIGPVYRSPELLRAAVEVSGVPVRSDTIGGVIMRRLVAEGRAEVVPVPANDPAKRRLPSVGSVSRFAEDPRILLHADLHFQRSPPAFLHSAPGSSVKSAKTATAFAVFAPILS